MTRIISLSKIIVLRALSKVNMKQEKKKSFCIAGPISETRNYFVPKRLNWPQIDALIDQMHYFILHAPRQSGKTSAILEFAKYLNEKGTCTALYLTTEPAHPAKNDIERAFFWLLSQCESQLSIQLPDQKIARDFLQPILKERPVPEDAFFRFLTHWAEINERPLVLFFDEVDGLVENTLISLLKQLRTGYTNRPIHFPQSICLIGVRNLQDYKLTSMDEEEKGILLSPFNIIADSLCLRNFTPEQVQDLYNQHTQESGQPFTREAVEHAYYLTQGQPWLTNALAYQASFRDLTDRSQPITKEVIEAAKDQLILRNDTHISSLTDRLNEPRVCNIIDAVISGSSDAVSLNPDDIQYVRDLGLVAVDSWEIANPIYQQIIPRALTQVLQELIKAESGWYIDASGKLNMNKLLNGFTDFFRENAEAYRAKTPYLESYPHLLLMAYLQRVINGGGLVHREYGVGKKRVDLLIEWKKRERFIIEIKIKYGEDTLKKGLKQTAEYFNLCNAKEGHLLIVDRNSKNSWEDRISNEELIFDGKKIHVWTL